MNEFITEDNGKREEFASGMVREPQDDKTRFDLAFDGPLALVFFSGLPAYDLLVAAKLWYDSPGLERAKSVINELVAYSNMDRYRLFEEYAQLMTRGAVKYSARNWMKAAGVAEFERFRSSFCRHLMQYVFGDIDEDHKAAIIFNMNGAEYVNASISEQLNYHSVSAEETPF